MTKVYVKKDKNNEFIDVNVFTAYNGFRCLGSEIIPFINIKEIVNNTPEDIIVSGIGDVRNILDSFNINYPILEYPEELKNFLGRKIWTAKLSKIMANTNDLNLFIKPVVGGKLFTGTVVKELKDLRAVAGLPLETEVYCSELVDFISEYRCFIRYGEVVGVKHYKGDWSKVINTEVLNKAIECYTKAPSAYVLDFGVTSKGETLLVEVNEGYSVGCYGLEAITYAKFLAARWSELTNTENSYNF